jgi:hypothetical protein
MWRDIRRWQIGKPVCAKTFNRAKASVSAACGIAHKQRARSPCIGRQSQAQLLTLESEHLAHGECMCTVEQPDLSASPAAGDI